MLRKRPLICPKEFDLFQRPGLRETGNRPLLLALTLLFSLALIGCSQSDKPSAGSANSPPHLVPAAGPSETSLPRETTPSSTVETQPPAQKRNKPVVKSEEKEPKGASARALNSRASLTVRLHDKNALEAETEMISGFKTPAEYLTISSKRFPEAVVAVMLPLEYERESKRKYPLVIAFGGAAECARPSKKGALAWIHYYKSDEAVLALGHNQLTSEDFRGLITPERLEDFNGGLKRHPYGGVILACPASPLLSLKARLEFPDYETFVMEELIPALKSRYRVAPGKIGVDGVSMGGSRSMYYGFKYPEVFSSIGSVQGAFGPYLDILGDLASKKKDLLRQRFIQLVTSDGDTMAPSVERLHRLLVSEDIDHVYLKLTGPHDYIFNQGPGALALLVFHNRVLGTVARGPVK
ncbi:MAG TPA: alpha/beta hydrolase-fold protein [Desulfomonilaceae bacterium]|nr:alpha/beta hydrolase-fold protein [Desulfomonilaceae bacterium]